MADPNPNIVHLDPGQIIKRSFDGVTDRLRVDAEVTATFIGPQEVVISHLDDSIRLGDGVSLITSTTIGPDVGLDVNVLNGLTGSVNIKAPTGPFEITVDLATDVATDPLPSPLPDRVSVSIRNKSVATTIYFGKNALVTPDDTATGGWEIGAGEDFNIDLDDTQNFYLITPLGDTAFYKILEIAST